MICAPINLTFRQAGRPIWMEKFYVSLESPKPRKTLTAVLCTLNEAPRIARCLEALRWCDEVIVVDRFSKDDTGLIARQFANVRFIERGEWVFDNTNFGFKEAKGDWIMRIDADEIVSTEMSQEILEILKVNDLRYTGYHAPNRVFFFGKWMRYGVAYDNRLGKARVGYNYRKMLFRKGTAYYECKRQHEDLTTTGEFGILHGHYDHFSHPSVSRWIEKMNHYTDIDAGLTDVLAPGFKPPHPAKTILALIKIFFHLYIQRMGYKDGLYGFITCALNTFYVLVERCKIWEKHYRATHPDEIENY